MSKKEVKKIIQVPLEIKELDEESGEFEGYASVFGNLDSYRDVVEAGAFAKTLKKSKGVIPILADHNPYKQIGWNLEAEERTKGLWVKGQLNLKVQLAVERHALAKQAKEAGAKMGLSIGYVTKVSEWDENKRTRFLKEVDLWEYSFVTYPANTRATVVNIKSTMDGLGLSVEDFTDSPKALEQFLREVGYSVSQSKKVASFATDLFRKEAEVPVDDSNLREVDEKKLAEVLEMCKSINRL